MPSIRRADYSTDKTQNFYGSNAKYFIEEEEEYKEEDFVEEGDKDENFIEEEVDIEEVFKEEEEE